MRKKYDFLIIGAGIIGLAIARSLKNEKPGAKILIIDKEQDAAFHASSRNSGILHAGFYYTADSLKAKFTVAGNRALKEYCRAKNLPLNQTGKLVVAQNEKELPRLYELEERGRKNGANVKVIDEKQAAQIEPNIKTFQKALYSPDTASVDPAKICLSIKKELAEMGVRFFFRAKFLGRSGEVVLTNQGDFESSKIINCSGLYADKIARHFGFGQKYTIIPFKGLYLKYTGNRSDIKTNIYPVPNLRNPFLGVHFTKTAEGEIKIGPTAIPALWRENYSFRSNFDLNEFLSISFLEMRLFITNRMGFRTLALEEIKKYNRSYLVNLAQNLVKQINPEGFTEPTKPGIRAQLFDVKGRKWVEDFVVEGDAKSVHILNAVSPAFTCAFPFADYVVKEYILT